MASKTYVPTLMLWLHKICVYIARYRNTLVSFLDDFGVTDGAAKIDALVAACEALTEQYDPDINP